MAVDGVLGVIVGGVIGITGSIAASFIPQILTQRRAKASANAITRAYIQGVLRMEEVRRHSALYQNNLNALRAGTTTNLLRIYGAEDLSDELQKALIGHVGLLEPDIAADVIQFCNQLNGLRVDLKAMALGHMANLSVPEKIDILEKDLALWNETQALGRNVVTHLS
jgi:hypothetical protein